MPIEFFDDFVQVAEDEGRHFSLLAARLEAIGSHYGALPGHDGLWESAEETSNSLRARLAVEHCVHEVRVMREESREEHESDSLAVADLGQRGTPRPINLSLLHAP